MKQEPTAFELLRLGLAPILDLCGVLMLCVLGWQVMFGGSQPFETQALWVGLIGALACWADPRAIRNVPLPMLGYVGVALLSAAVHRWPEVSRGDASGWWTLFDPAFHLVIMTALVYGASYLLRTPERLSLFMVLMVASVSVVAVQILFDRASTKFIYNPLGSAHLPSVAQWGGLHQTGLLLVLGLPMPVAMALLSRSKWQVVAGLLLACGLILVASINGSRGGIATMLFVGTLMATVRTGRRRGGWRSFVLAVVALMIAVALSILLFPTRESTSAGSLYGRTRIWRAALAISLDNMALGVGPGNYPRAMLDGGYAAAHLISGSAGVDQAHNTLLQTGAELGMAGALCLLMYWLWMLDACWRARTLGFVPMLSFGMASVLTGFMIRSMSDNFLDGLGTTDRTRVLVWSLFASVLAIQRLPRWIGQGDR